MDILNINGDDIRLLRERLGWTRAKLSEESGVPDRTIQDIETGKSKNPGINTLKELFRAMPNYPDARRNELILNIQLRLSALDYNQLRTVSASIDDLSDISTLKPKATRAD